MTDLSALFAVRFSLRRVFCGCGRDTRLNHKKLVCIPNLCSATSNQQTEHQQLPHQHPFYSYRQALYLHRLQRLKKISVSQPALDPIQSPTFAPPAMPTFLMRVIAFFCFLDFMYPGWAGAPVPKTTV